MNETPSIPSSASIREPECQSVRKPKVKTSTVNDGRSLKTRKPIETPESKEASNKEKQQSDGTLEDRHRQTDSKKYVGMICIM
jgi:hypothetical protein